MTLRRRLLTTLLALGLGACGFNVNDPRAGETVVSLDDPPPPIAGGTLTVTRDGAFAVASDPDRDEVQIVRLTDHTVRRVSLAVGDEPGRVIEGRDGIVHVVLRSGDALATIDVASLALTRTPTCEAPRGVAWDGARVHVACATGELISFEALDQPPVRTLRLERDLRDVIAIGDRLVVTRFRAATMTVIDASGTVLTTATPASATYTDATTHHSEAFTPMVAWRAIATGDGRVLMTHEAGRVGPGFAPTVSHRYYGGQTPGWTPPCGQNTALHSSISLTTMDGSAQRAPILADVGLPVDVALHGDDVAVVSASELDSFRTAGPQLLVTRLSTIDAAPTCVSAASDRRFTGEPIAVAYAPDGTLLVQTREPAELTIGDDVVTLAEGSHRDSGHELFHSDSGIGIACASCHPEGGSDGHVWQFPDVGTRQTQLLRGGIANSAPFHWTGDESDFVALTHTTFEQRMGGPPLSHAHSSALSRWLDQIPAEPAPPALDAAAATRGRALFERADVGCATCHDGPRLSDETNHSVGTGLSFQSGTLLELGARLPIMHDGCARSIEERFSNVACGGGAQHGGADALSDAERADLIAYLDTL